MTNESIGTPAGSATNVNPAVPNSNNNNYNNITMQNEQQIEMQPLNTALNPYPTYLTFEIVSAITNKTELSELPEEQIEGTLRKGDESSSLKGRQNQVNRFL